MTMRTWEQIVESLNDDERQLFADTINHGYWGDTEEEFSDGVFGVDGYITDDAHLGGHFVRKELSHRFRRLFKSLGLQGDKWHKYNDEMKWYHDWWGDGSGSILLIRNELTEDLEQWAKEHR